MTKQLVVCWGLGSRHRSTSPANQQHEVGFFEGENYELALQRLDKSYLMLTDLIEQMQDHSDMFLKQAEMNARLAKTGKCRLDKQTKIVSYGTTRAVLHRLAESAESPIPVLENVSKEVQEVIRECVENRDEIYRRKKLRHGFEHRQTKRIRKLFENAREPVDNANASLQRLRRQRSKANDTPADVQQKYDEIKSNHSATELEKQDAKSNRARKQSEVNALDQQIQAAEEDLIETKLRYQREAAKIFEECDQLEKERLDFIQRMVLKYLDTIHPLKYFYQLSEIYDQVKYDIQTKQNTAQDMEEWQRKYIGSTDSLHPSGESV